MKCQHYSISLDSNKAVSKVRCCACMYGGIARTYLKSGYFPLTYENKEFIFQWLIGLIYCMNICALSLHEGMKLNVVEWPPILRNIGI